MPSPIIKKEPIKGLNWLEFEDSEFSIICGCPSEAIKHLIQHGLIREEVNSKNETYLKGPLCILLNDQMFCGRQVANLAEFPFFHILYFQGLLFRENFSGVPIVGNKECIEVQKEYLKQALYGIIDPEVLRKSGLDSAFLEELILQKKFFAGGDFQPIEKFANFQELNQESLEVHPGIYIKRVEKNRFKVSYRDSEVIVDLNIPEGQRFKSFFDFEKRNLPKAKFMVIDTGCGDGWSTTNPHFSSLIRHNDRFFQIDAGFNIARYLESLHLYPEDLEGIFLSHTHDDHFACLTEFIHSAGRMKIFTTRLIHLAAKTKFEIITSKRFGTYEEVFEPIFLEYDSWQDLDGLEVLCLHTAHPVEDVAFHFRARNESGEYVSYSHYADLTSFKMLDKMQHARNSAEFIEKIRANYRMPSDLKKIDVGGGMIHGEFEDFEKDASKKLILGHFSTRIEDENRGTALPFGSSTILIP